MKTFLSGSVFLALIIYFAACTSPDRKPTPVDQVHTYVQSNIDSLNGWLKNEFIPLISATADSNQIRNSFYKGRKLYKRIEFAVEYFFGNSARNLNGPPLPEIEPEEHIVIEPGGFQVVEEFLFPYDTTQKKELLREAMKMKSILLRTETLWAEHQFRDDQVFDALRLQCYRIITLGISGFDTPLSFQGIEEIPESLASIRTLIGYYDHEKIIQLTDTINQAIGYSVQNNHFNHFDRLTFITRYVNPVTRQLLRIQKEMGIPILKNIYALSGDTETLFDEDAFNRNYFTPDGNSHVTEEKALLGKRLFFDPILSGNKTISCASCHQPDKAFTDGLTKSRALAGTGFVDRNTPTLLNAGLQKAQFYDMRSIYLEDQVRNVIENKDEIHGDMQQAAKELIKDSNYLQLFSLAFPKTNQPVSERSIQVALAAFIRSLPSFHSRFDQYMRGDEKQLNEEEKKGFNLFMGKAKCGICHFMPVFNGTVPPTFTFTESEVIGVPADKNGKRLDPDMGRYGIYQIENYKNAFKTPTVRNIAVTAPYMHNGVFTTLEEVVEFYNRGGGNGLGLALENQTLPFDSLMLTTPEKQALIAFMKTLSD